MITCSIVNQQFYRTQRYTRISVDGHALLISNTEKHYEYKIVLEAMFPMTSVNFNKLKYVFEDVPVDVAEDVFFWLMEMYHETPDGTKKDRLFKNIEYFYNIAFND